MLPWTSAVSDRWSQVMSPPVMFPLELVSWRASAYPEGRVHGCGLTWGSVACTLVVFVQPAWVPWQLKAPFTQKETHASAELISMLLTGG